MNLTNFKDQFKNCPLNEDLQSPMPYNDSVDEDDFSMNEGTLMLQVNAEEHELINFALTQMLDTAYELFGSMRDANENSRVQLINNLREKSFELWAERFNG